MPSRIFSLIAILCLLTTSSVWAQDTRGTITGRVTDPSGAVITGANVVVSNTATGTKATLNTNTDGIYRAGFLNPGIYEVEVSAPGFKKAVRSAIEVRVADRLEINIPMEIGASEQQVTVTSDVPLLNTESASLGTVIDSKRVASLPLSYGNPFALIGVSSGTGFMGSPRLDRPFEPTHIANFSMNGTLGDRSDITLDGAPATATANAGQIIASYVPPTDILAEFKVQTAIFDAAAGNTEGGVTNLSIKSGTNQYHGTGYYNWTRKNLWANDFFNNKLGKERPDFRPAGRGLVSKVAVEAFKSRRRPRTAQFLVEDTYLVEPAQALFAFATDKRMLQQRQHRDGREVLGGGGCDGEQQGAGRPLR